MTLSFDGYNVCYLMSHTYVYGGWWSEPIQCYTLFKGFSNVWDDPLWRQHITCFHQWYNPLLVERCGWWSVLLFCCPVSPQKQLCEVGTIIVSAIMPHYKPHLFFSFHFCFFTCWFDVVYLWPCWLLSGIWDIFGAYIKIKAFVSIVGLFGCSVCICPG